MQKVFLDANILLDIFDNTRPYHASSTECLQFVLEKEGFVIYTSCDIITTVYYLLSKISNKSKLGAIAKINQLCKIIEFGNDEIEQSIKLMQNDSDYKDLEDTIQYTLAQKANCDFILSNDKYFVSKDIKLFSSADFLK